MNAKIVHAFLLGMSGLAFNADASAATSTIIADSVSQFSGTQGQDNWQYGYYQSPLNPAGFQTMANFNGTAWVVGATPGQSPFVWTSLSAIGGHPNGTQTSGGRDTVEQWAVRRWVSNLDGAVTITGHIADADTNTGNGVIAHIFVNNTEVFNHLIDTALGLDYSIDATIAVGTTIDFVIDPRASNDLSDSTNFSAQIATVPLPASLWLFASALAGLNRFGRHRRT